MSHEHRAWKTEKWEVTEPKDPSRPPQMGDPIYIVPVELCTCGMRKWGERPAEPTRFVGIADTTCEECARAFANGGMHVH